MSISTWFEGTTRWLNIPSKTQIEDPPILSVHNIFFARSEHPLAQQIRAEYQRNVKDLAAKDRTHYTVTHWVFCPIGQGSPTGTTQYRTLSIQGLWYA